MSRINGVHFSGGPPRTPLNGGGSGGGRGWLWALAIVALIIGAVIASQLGGGES